MGTWKDTARQSAAVEYGRRNYRRYALIENLKTWAGPLGVAALLGALALAGVWVAHHPDQAATVVRWVGGVLLVILAVWLTQRWVRAPRWGRPDGLIIGALVVALLAAGVVVIILSA